MRILNLLLLNFFTLTFACSQTFQMDQLTMKAYNEILQLRLEEATVSIGKAKNASPNNLMPIFVEDYIDFLKIVINENEAQFKNLLPTRDARLAKLDKTKGDSPYHLYTKAQIHIHWALAKVKFGHYLNAFNEIKKAYVLLKRNKEKYPNFGGNRIALGVLTTILGTIPEQYQWGVNLLGMEGSVNKGLSEIRAGLQASETKDNFFFKQEGAVMYAFLLLHFGNEEAEAHVLLKKTLVEPEKSPLFSFLLANMNIHLNKNEEAIKLLQNRPRGKAYFSFHYADYVMGVALLNKLSPEADVYLKKYVDNHPGIHFVKDAYQRLAWSALLNGRPKEYRFYMDLVKTKGAAMMESDKSALRLSKEDKLPNLSLLKARLLYDGGYDLRSLSILQEKSYKDFDQERDLLEFAYRKGRIFQRLGEKTKAIAEFEKVIQAGSHFKYYFACNAALQCGLIYEKSGEKEKAYSYFKKCLSLHPEEHKDGLHQKAKAGLGRLKG